jgi:hypothetical protein
LIRRGRHHLPQPAEPRQPFSCSSARCLNPVIRSAIGRRQVTMTDCDKQPVIGSLQSAPNAEYGGRPSQWGSTARNSQNIQFGAVQPHP